ncbi:MAG: ArgK/MeaB family GTPase [Deltaproteobacteria bacterium]
MRKLVDEARRGSIRAASRLISLLEDDPCRLCELFSEFTTWPQARLTVGITGPPGCGKSTLINVLILLWRQREPAGRVGVLAVDPCSPYSGGAVLGDRVRMMNHSDDDRVFIRSLSTRGHVGGLTAGIRGSLRVMGLAGCDVVLLETVGVGQSENEVAGVADLVCVVLAPGQGDSVQLMKAGLLESADIFVINKSDRPGADRLYAQLGEELGTGRAGRRAPAIFKVSGLNLQGITELVDGIEQRARQLSDELVRRRDEALACEVWSTIGWTIRRLIDRVLADSRLADDAASRILSGEATVPALIAELLEQAIAGLRVPKFQQPGLPGGSNGEPSPGRLTSARSLGSTP